MNVSPQRDQIPPRPDLRNSVLRELLGVANYLDAVEGPGDLNPLHGKRILDACYENRPLELVLPAFPAKSGNREKTLSSLPDLGEVLALKRLDELCNRIRRHHRPGAHLVICSDGRVFSDLVGVTEEDVTRYGLELKNIVQRFGLGNIRFFDLEDVFGGRPTFGEMRTRLEDEYAEPMDRLRQRVRTDDATRTLFNGIHRFIKEDYLFLHPERSRNQVSRLAKDVAYQVIRRSNAWGALVAEHFPRALRLSIHPQPAGSAKFPVRLMGGVDPWGTPWHRVPLFDGMNFRLVRHSEALQRKACLKRTPEGYVYFEGVQP